MIYVPFREQAGSQKGSMEHNATLRLPIDLAHRRANKLCVYSVILPMAYDQVCRASIICMLCKLVCGVLMLEALVAMHAATSSVIGTASITSKVGVKEGSPISSILLLSLLIP